MSKEKQIEEMARLISMTHEYCEVLALSECIKRKCEYPHYEGVTCRAEHQAEALYNAGYRKQSENVIELPCKIGDLLYMPWEWKGQKGIACLTVTVLRCITGFGWSFGTDFDTDDEDYYEAYNCGSFNIKDFGKTVFLTREEAEAKMKGGGE